MRVPSHPDADQELEQAALFYEQRSQGLGDDFLDEFEQTLERIIAHPIPDPSGSRPGSPASTSTFSIQRGLRNPRRRYLHTGVGARTSASILLASTAPVTPQES